MPFTMASRFYDTRWHDYEMCATSTITCTANFDWKEGSLTSKFLLLSCRENWKICQRQCYWKSCEYQEKTKIQTNLL